MRYTQVGRAYRYSNPEDDSIGGAVPSGTVLHDFIQLSLEPIQPTMALLEQGLVTPHFFKTSISPIASDLQENDEIEIILPVTSWYYGYRFRLVGEMHPSIIPGDPRSHLVATLRRIDTANGPTSS